MKVTTSFLFAPDGHHGGLLLQLPDHEVVADVAPVDHREDDPPRGTTFFESVKLYSRITTVTFVVLTACVAAGAGAVATAAASAKTPSASAVKDTKNRKRMLSEPSSSILSGYKVPQVATGWGPAKREGR